MRVVEGGAMISLPTEVSDRDRIQHRQFLASGEHTSKVLTTQEGFELLELLYCFESLGRFLRLRSDAGFLPDLGPWALGSTRKANTGLPARLAPSTASQVMERSPSAAQILWRHVAVTVGDDADHRASFGRHLYAFVGGFAGLRRESLHGAPE